ncbi:MAG TPA: glycosyltransferase [Candidatus Saccharimonadales bacterium]|nr:glycosyltransferase [Candidatus Saccharimonadales bacterium]
MNNKPQISFIIPARNEENFIGNCLDSIQRQELSDSFEVIVVNNNSTDKTVLIARTKKARIEYENKPGLSNVRAKGVESANGQIIIFIDADTVLPPQWAKIATGWLKKSENIVAISCGFKFYDGKFYEKIACTLFQSINPLCSFLLGFFGKPQVLYGQSFAVRKSSLIKAGGINMDFPFYAEDIAMAERLRKVGKIKYLNSIKVSTSARRYRKLGIVKTLYYYLIPTLLLLIGRYDSAKKFASNKKV